MSCHIEHTSLNSHLEGLVVGGTHQYRGIPYGSISKRFARPEPVLKLTNPLSCKEYGPRCPQNQVDVRYLLRIPTTVQLPEEPEDEFQCLNLNVVTPTSSSSTGLPVVVWIHGGSQVVTFCSPASGVCDPTRIVEDSYAQGQPLVFVSLNYRLNIFAFGNGGGEENLALQDQRTAISWVQQHISGFGGDPNNITLAGESAGAVYCHAHLVSNAPIRRVILSSGSLYLSPPQPKERGALMIKSLENILADIINSNLEDAPVEDLLHAMTTLNLNTMWLQMTPDLEQWTTKLGNAEDLLIGDTEYESVIWAMGIGSMGTNDIVSCFGGRDDSLEELRSLYGIVEDRPSSCRTGALDYLNDLRFALPVEIILECWKSAGRHAYRYTVDQSNPWQSSHRAHHAIDLLFLFGGIDMSDNPAAERIGKEMRKRWIEFANGKAPWHEERCYAFGPHGVTGQIAPEDIRARKRQRHLDLLRSLDPTVLATVFGKLSAGRLSLLN